MTEESKEKFEWFKFSNSFVTLLGALFIVWQMNGIDNRFSSLEQRLDRRLLDVETRIASIEKDMAIVKTVLMMKEIYPHEMATSGEKYIGKNS